jgi:uncharacterized Zn finger protein
MDVISFLVQGSSSRPYVVSFSRLLNSISCKCTCPAGLKGQACKHRLRILRGSSENIVSGNLNDVETVSSWLPGSEIERVLLEVERLEHEASNLKSELTSAKKKLAKAMGT